jgi:protein-L-isoaspartate(D-aspartate) O-methyltransferase
MNAALRLDEVPNKERVGAAAFVLSLRGRGVSDIAVLRALETVPRELFAPRRFADLARSDVALPLACGQTMTAPATVAQMLMALDLRPGQSVLEVGTGSGYVTALLVKLGGQVRSLERRPILHESAGARLAAAGLADAVDLVCGDGLADEAGAAGYDRILLNGVVAGVPASLTDHLLPGGRIVAATATDGTPRLLIVTRDPNGSLSHAIGAPLRLSPLVFSGIGKDKMPARNRCLT